MAGEDGNPNRPPAYWRETAPATLALGVGAVTIIVGAGMALWGLSWLGVDAGRGTGLLVLAAFMMLVIAVPLAIFGGMLCWVGWRGRQRGWIRGPAIGAGVVGGATLAVAVFLVTGLVTEQAQVNVWSALLPVGGGLLGWRWGVRLRRRHPGWAPDDDGTQDDAWRTVAGVDVRRPGRAGVVAGLCGAGVGIALSFAVPLVGGLVFWGSLLVAVLVPAWFWVGQPAYRRFADG